MFWESISKAVVPVGVISMDLAERSSCKVAVFEMVVGAAGNHFRRAQTVGVVAQVLNQKRGDGAVCFIHGQHIAPAVSSCVATLIRRLPLSKRVKTSVTAVLEVGVVLVGKPCVFLLLVGSGTERTGGRIDHGEVALVAHSPDHASVACSIGVVDLDDPVLIAKGKQEIAVRG